MTKGVVVHFDRSKIGSGQRVVFVLAVGRKWVQLFYPAGMTYTKELLTDYETALVRECDPKENRRLVKLLKRNVKSYDELGLRYSKKTVKELKKK